MKTVLLTLKGERYYLYYNTMAFFELDEELGEEWEKRMREKSEEGLRLMTKALEVMSVQGATLRAEFGYSRPNAIDAEEIIYRINPKEYLDISEAVFKAYTIGWQRDISDDIEEIDLGLQEIQKKRKANNLC